MLKCERCGDCNLIKRRDSKNTTWISDVYRCKYCGHTYIKEKRKTKNV